MTVHSSPDVWLIVLMYPIRILGFWNCCEWIKHDDLTQQLDIDWIIHPLSPWQRCSLFFLSPHLFSSPGSAVPPISDKEKMPPALTFQKPNSTVRSFLMLLHFYWLVCLCHPRFAVSLSLPSISFCSHRILLSRGMCMSERGGTGSLSWTMAALWCSKVNGISPSCLKS